MKCAMEGLFMRRVMQKMNRFLFMSFGCVLLSVGIYFLKFLMAL